MATCRRSVPVTTVLLLIAVGIAQLLQPARSFSTNRQLERLLGKLNDIDEDDAEQLYEENVNRVAKRESKGTCTCTCETRPVPVSDHSSQPSASAPTSNIVQHPAAKLQAESRIPESAPLMRTATTTAKETKSKQQQPQSPPQQQTRGDAKLSAAQQKAGQKSNAASSGSGVGIVKVPPISQDYDVAEHSTNDAVNVLEPETSDEDYDESRQQEQEQPRYSQIETWALGSRFPWERLPDTMCFREHCSADRDCCRRFNICDRSAHVCVDCWYGSTCTSEKDCCLKYKYCQREWKPNPATGVLEIVGGKCVSELPLEGRTDGRRSARG